MGVAILIYDKINFKLKQIRQDKEGQFILIKGKIKHKHDDIAIVNIYVPNPDTPNFIKQILVDFKTLINSSSVTVGDLSTTLYTTYRLSEQKTTEKHHN